MKGKVIVTFLLMVWLVQSVAVHAEGIPWEASPNNWRNSQYNYENSSYNFANSPKNFKNAEGTRGRLNIVDLLGSVTGYAIPKKDGGINYFDNDGTRIGYSIDGGKTQYDIKGEEATFTVEVQE